MSGESKRENVWLNLGFNIVVPSALLIKGKALVEWCGFELQPSDAAVAIFCLALLFPLAYGIWDLVSRRKFNIFSVIGILSVVLTGGIGLMKLSREWMIVKEGAVPLALGVAVLISAFTKKPLVSVLLMNDSVVNVEKIHAELTAKSAESEFDSALKTATYIVSASFLLSSVLNFALAAWIYKSPAGTDEFNAEVGRMTALSFPVIVLPTMVVFIYALFKLFGDITRITGLTLEDLVKVPEKKAE